MKRLALILASLLAGCSATNQANKSGLHITGGNLAPKLALVSKPQDPTTELAQLQRYRGQTSYLERAFRGGFPNDRGGGGPVPAPGGAAPKAPDREQQESDVFKIGKPGSKLLYLMNEYRGLQVVSFGKGAEQPELLGRVPTVGETVDEMYSDLARNRLISIEHTYKYEDGKDQSHSILGVYDVSDSKAPKLARTIDVDGLVMDSRIVGDVLYVASRQDDKGLVTSYSLTSDDLHKVEQHQLSLPVSYEQNMNIIESEDGQSYYLVAVLQANTWGWWRNASSVDVVDISNPQGKIKPIMSVAVKGFVNERSQTTIKNNTLIVTSNYDPKDDQDASAQPQPPRQRILRIAVETFKFPDVTSETITSDEAEFRKLNIARELAGHYGADRDQLEQQLMNDATLGLRGRFVRAGETLHKIVDDTIITVGDGSGLSAQLQDVRYQDGLLYAFWVPNDGIDPFDMFDISQPEQGVKYIGRLHFDGWIDRAIPITYQNRKFVLGLGWILPVVDNDAGRRQPQAMLFEIKQNAQGKPQANDIAQLSLEGSNIWTNFNGQDKMIEVRATSDSQGEILFAAEKFANGDYGGGGQILKYDVANATITQGPFLSGGADWIRRVFTNSEISRINSFSDHALATFSSPQATGDEHPVNILELARNIQAYETLGTTGVQIVTDGFWGAKDSTTDLRAVSETNVDAEQAQATAHLTLPGAYAAHVVVNNNLYILTSSDVSGRDASGQWTYTETIRLTEVDQNLKEVAHQDWTSTNSNGATVPDIVEVSLQTAIVKLADGSLLVSAGHGLHKVETTANMKIQDLELGPNCATQDRVGFTIQAFNSQPYLATEQQIDSRDFDGEKFTRKFLSPLTIGASMIDCQATYNIPGDVRAVNAKGDLLVEDNWVSDMRALPTSKQTPWSKVEATNEHSLLSLTIVNGQAVLKDEAALADENHMVYGPMRCPGCWRPQGDFTTLGQELVKLTPGQLDLYSVDQDSMIAKDTRSFSLDLDSEEAQVSGLVQNGDDVYGVLKENRKVQIVKWSSKDLRPQTQITADIPGGSWWSIGAIHFTPSLNSFEFSQGWNGLTQVRVTH